MYKLYSLQRGFPEKDTLGNQHSTSKLSRTNVSLVKWEETTLQFFYSLYLMKCQQTAPLFSYLIFPGLATCTTKASNLFRRVFFILLTLKVFILSMRLLQQLNKPCFLPYFPFFSFCTYVLLSPFRPQGNIQYLSFGFSSSIGQKI